MFEIFGNNERLIKLFKETSKMTEPPEPIEKLLYNRFIELIKQHFKKYKDKKPDEFPYYLLGAMAYGYFDIEKILNE